LALQELLEVAVGAAVVAGDPSATSGFPKALDADVEVAE
jgi:hypothetical protein